MGSFLGWCGMSYPEHLAGSCFAFWPTATRQAIHGAHRRRPQPRSGTDEAHCHGACIAVQWAQRGPPEVGWTIKQPSDTPQWKTCPLLSRCRCSRVEPVQFHRVNLR